MLPPTVVTLTVPLTLPLDLANQLDQESRRSGCSIPDMLSCMLVDAMAAREQQEFDAAAATDLLNSPLLTRDLTPPLTVPNGTPH